MEAVLNPQEVGKGIADFGFLIIAGASYVIFSTTLFYFFIRWFVRIVDGIIINQQGILEEILEIQEEQREILEKIVDKLNDVA